MSDREHLGIVLLSGGLDSTVVAAWALRQGVELSALTFHYGQTHAREALAAAQVARALGIPHQKVDLSFFSKLAWYSALTSPEQFRLPQGRSPERMAKDIPITYVPLRNTLFLTLAAASLESRVLDAIERRGRDPEQVRASIFLGPNAIDYSGYPDCRPEYYQQMATALALGSKMGAQYGIELHLETPIISQTKAEIVRLGLELGAPLELTWSCYQGGDLPCGRCDSCLLRARGFAEAEAQDPLLVRLAREKR
jgi:7-cyano-7-deazaguanine synthase